MCAPVINSQGQIFCVTLSVAKKKQTAASELSMQLLLSNLTSKDLRQISPSPSVGSRSAAPFFPKQALKWGIYFPVSADLSQVRKEKRNHSKEGIPVDR